MGKFCICSSYAIIYQVAGEVFPTVVRSLGIGLATVLGNLGNVLMPYIVFSAVTYRYQHSSLFTSGAHLSCSTPTRLAEPER